MAGEHRQPRMRVFAGPNGSGKSTVINLLRDYTVNDRPLDLGYYINADIIAADLRKPGGHHFNTYALHPDWHAFEHIIRDSGLLNDSFGIADLKATCEIRHNALRCLVPGEEERIAQMGSDFLRKLLLADRRRFSFETVFSHESKLDIMRQAIAAGYKVYLYFVCTESSLINTFRVEARTRQGGHDVPKDKIESRYTRALDLMHDAAQLAYQAYFFDNSVNEEPLSLFAHFKVVSGKKVWDIHEDAEIPEWFIKYYVDKVRS